MIIKYKVSFSKALSILKGDIFLLLNRIKTNFLFAVIRGKSSEDAIKIAEMSIEVGIHNIEINYTNPEAGESISYLFGKYEEDEEIIIGAGTVLKKEQAKLAVNSGAKFLVSPHFSAEVNSLCKKKRTLYFPGCMTPTEIVCALDQGVKLFKIFPGGTVGSRFIKDIHGPFPDIDLMPSGGVSIENILEWKKSGACAVGLGSALTEKLDTEGYESVRKVAKDFVRKLKEAKE